MQGMQSNVSSYYIVQRCICMCTLQKEIQITALFTVAPHFSENWYRALFGLGGIKPVVAGGGATAHGALGPSWGAAPMGGMPVGDMAGDPSMEGMPMGGATSHLSMGSMPVAATWERSAQRTAPAVDAMGGGLQ